MQTGAVPGPERRQRFRKGQKEAFNEALNFNGSKNFNGTKNKIGDGGEEEGKNDPTSVFPANSYLPFHFSGASFTWLGLVRSCLILELELELELDLPIVSDYHEFAFGNFDSRFFSLFFLSLPSPAQHHQFRLVAILCSNQARCAGITDVLSWFLLSIVLFYFQGNFFLLVCSGQGPSRSPPHQKLIDFDKLNYWYTREINQLPT